MSKTQKIRIGLYQLGQYRIEDYYTGQHWTWRVTDTNNYSDPWMGDYPTKKAAIEALTER